jgi:hypothetical protein
MCGCQPAAHPGPVLKLAGPSQFLQWCHAAAQSSAQAGCRSPLTPGARGLSPALVRCRAAHAQGPVGPPQALLQQAPALYAPTATLCLPLQHRALRCYQVLRRAPTWGSARKRPGMSWCCSCAQCQASWRYAAHRGRPRRQNYCRVCVACWDRSQQCRERGPCRETGVSAAVGRQYWRACRWRRSLTWPA